jgi:hypothetical protein
MLCLASLFSKELIGFLWFWPLRNVVQMGIKTQRVVLSRQILNSAYKLYIGSVPTFEIVFGVSKPECIAFFANLSL